MSQLLVVVQVEDGAEFLDIMVDLEEAVVAVVVVTVQHILVKEILEAQERVPAVAVAAVQVVLVAQHQDRPVVLAV
jgi:hypothetical protein